MQNTKMTKKNISVGRMYKKFAEVYTFPRFHDDCLPCSESRRSIEKIFSFSYALPLTDVTYIFLRFGPKYRLNGV